MKNSVKLDVVSANDRLLDKNAKVKSSARKRKSSNKGDAYSIVKSLGSPWKESTWGAELKAKTQNASATTNVFKKEDNSYGIRLSVDITDSINSLESDSAQSCIQNIMVGIDSVADVCSQLSRKLASSCESNANQVANAQEEV